MGLGGRVSEVVRRLCRGKSRRVAVVAASVLALGGGGGLLLHTARDGAQAQTWPGYYSSSYNPSDLPGVRLSIQTDLVSPSSPDLTTVYGSPSSPAAPAPSARIIALARSLENNPDRIYQFVRNTILFEPQFGLHKGADGVLLDGSGGSFDQAQLMVELLRVSGYQARYVLGTVSLSGADAASVLRVETGRQACVLLATAGTPATVNGQTACSSAGSSLSGVEMMHVWVEASIGGTWYAFDPSLKTNTKIAGVNLWAAAGTSAASAWSNVSSGVSVSGGDLNGVNATHIRNDMAGYATALQTALIANHSDKSLRQLTGGWEINRTEAAPRNASLPSATVSTRWDGDVPAPYRATLTLQTAGFNQTFDLPSIYGWRTQAQLHERVLRVAVRKVDHLNAAHGAYLGKSAHCTAPTVCGTDPSQSEFDAWNRRLDLTVNHPYAARRSGVQPNSQPWPAGTFADETVSKSIETGKRVDILVRTAGGTGDRAAVWDAAMDPVQQQRIIPAGDAYQCASQGGDTMITVEECDGTGAEDWRYWLQDTTYGIRLFARGEIAAAEMGSKKDGLLNVWQDLFDNVVRTLEPLSGARIFHQHSIGVALSPSYQGNTLDIDTSVGVATGGTDQPHHILSALAAMAVTAENLALNYHNAESGAVAENGGSRFGAGADGLKVLTAPGATAGLPASVSADTRAKIEDYLAKGFSVVATTSGPQNAFLARRNDGTEQAWIIRQQTQWTMSADVDSRTAFRKGAIAEPRPLDYLGKAEANRLAANVAGSQLGAVDLRNGTLSFSEGTELSMGQGDFPYSLSFSRSYNSTGPVEGPSGLGMGWTHNWESSVSRTHDLGVLFPKAGAVSAAPMLISALVALEAGRADNIQADAVSGVALNWLQDQVFVTTVSGGGQTGRFIRLVDGTWYNPASPTESLTDVGSSGSLGKQFDWRLADRSVMAFRDVTNTYTGGSTSRDTSERQGALVSWTFPTGVVITLTYTQGHETNPPLLATVENNLDAKLTFTHSLNPTVHQTNACFEQAGGIAYGGGGREARQGCYATSRSSGRLLKVAAGSDEVRFSYTERCPIHVNYCAFQLLTADRPGLRARYYSYATPTGALAYAASAEDYLQVLTQVSDDGVATPRARFDWRAVAGQVAPYVAEAFDAQDRKTTYYSSTFTYSSAKDATDAVIRQTYDEDGRLATSADAMGRTSRARYDGPGRTRWIQSPWGDQTTFAYDPRGNLIQRTQTPIAGCADGLTAEQQAWWCQTVTVLAEYHPTWNKPTKITLPATAADPTPRDWVLTYNSRGLLETQTGPEVFNALNGSPAHPVWRFWYDAYGRTEKTQDPTGIESEQTYGGGGLPAFCLRVQTASSQSGGIAGLTTTQTCDAVGNVTSVTDPRGHTTTAGYDVLRRKTSQTGPSGTGIQTQWVYDLNGDLVQEKRWDSAAATWRTTTTTYSATHKPLTVTDPAGDVSRTCYDAVDRPVMAIDGEQRATHTVYNAAGQPVTVYRWYRTDAGTCEGDFDLPSGQTDARWRRYEYNAAGLPSAEIDARGARTEQVYDGLGRAARTIYADGSQAWTAMDQRGNAVFRKQRGGHRADLFYDAVGRNYHMREYGAAQVGLALVGRNSRASYDLAGHLIWRDVSTQVSTTVFDETLLRDTRTHVYDVAGRLVHDHWRPEGPGGLILSSYYGYDLASNRTSITWPDSWTATYGYDAANRVQTVSFPGSGGAVTISHDSLSRRTGIDRPGAAADTSYAYEIDSDLSSLGHGFTGGTGPGATTFSYGHDASARLTSIAINQPAFEWLPTLAYARSYGAANALNQISSAGGTAVGWDPDGNMTSDGVNTYSWTYGNRMSGASRAGMTATYDYDTDDRRTKKTVDGVVTRTLWSGADELAELDAAGNVLRRFVPDGTGAMDARLATVANTGEVYWLHVDHQGSVIATSDSAGQTVGVAAYSPFGEFGDGQSAPPQHSPFGYTGRQFDPETGLYQYRARYYSPKLGQFLSTDPIGTQDDPNLYMYVANDPVNGTDPTGKQVFVGGQFDNLFDPMRTARARYIQAHPGRRTWFVPHNDGSAMQRALEENFATDQPVVVFSHSRGFNTAMRGMQAEPDIPVSLFVSLDPVSQNDLHPRIQGFKPDSVSLWVNVEGEPTQPNLSDGIAALGDAVTPGDGAPTRGADIEIAVDQVHANAPQMLNAASEYIDQTLCRPGTQCDQ